MPVCLQFDSTRFMQEELCLLCCRDSKQARRDSVDVGLARKSTYKYDNNGKRIAKQPRLSVPGTRFDGTQVCLLIAHNSVYSLRTICTLNADRSFNSALLFVCCLLPSPPSQNKCMLELARRMLCCWTLPPRPPPMFHRGFFQGSSPVWTADST